MANELEGIAGSLADVVNGKTNVNFENLVKLMSCESGKKVMSQLLSDGGAKVKRAAMGVKNGDLSGVQGIISAIAETEEGKELLTKFSKESK